jgi:hypothetical protein
MFSIWQWANAFDIFMSIYLTNHPNSVLEHYYFQIKPILSSSSLWEGNKKEKSTYMSPQIRDICFSFTLNPNGMEFFNKETDEM